MQRGKEGRETECEEHRQNKSQRQVTGRAEHHGKGKTRRGQGKKYKEQLAKLQQRAVVQQTTCHDHGMKLRSMIELFHSIPWSFLLVPSHSLTCSLLLILILRILMDASSTGLRRRTPSRAQHCHLAFVKNSSDVCVTQATNTSLAHRQSCTASKESFKRSTSWRVGLVGPRHVFIILFP